MIAQQTSIDRQAGVRPLRWAVALIGCLILSPALTPVRADDGPEKKVEREKPAEVWYRGKRVDNRFGERPETDESSFSEGAFDLPPIDELTETTQAPPVEFPLPKAGKDDVEVIKLPQLPETELPAAPKPLRTEDTQSAERLMTPTGAPAVLQVPPPWYLPPFPITESTVNNPTDDSDQSASEQKLDTRVQQAAAVTDHDFENRYAQRLSLESEAHSQDGSLAVAQRWAAPITVAFVVAALTTICTMLVISLVITRRFRESVFRVELSNANMLSYGVTPPAAEVGDEGAEEEDRVDPLQPRGVATELFDLPLEALVEKTYHAKRQEEAEEQEAITESMMQCLFEDNLKLREGIRDAE